jgi:hypothetical protein
MQELLHDLRNVDAIITDPCYGRDSLPLYGDLAKLAAKALRPQGVLAVMCGQSYLPEILAAMTKHMTYRWTMAISRRFALSACGPGKYIHDGNPSLCSDQYQGGGHGTL